MTERIIIASSLISAVTVTVSCILTCYKTARKIDEWKYKMEKHDKENYLNILRLIITNENMPLEERISAGDKYINAGGNGTVKKLYQRLIERL